MTSDFEKKLVAEFNKKFATDFHICGEITCGCIDAKDGIKDFLLQVMREVREDERKELETYECGHAKVAVEKERERILAGIEAVYVKGTNKAEFYSAIHALISTPKE